MGISWAFLVLEAMLLAEVNVELMRRRAPEEQLHSQVLSLRTMAEETMGPLGGLLTTVIYLMLSYTLLVAYISKSGEVLSLLLHVPNRAADLLFTVALGGLLGVGGAKMADSVNQVLTIMLLGEYVHSA
jgi:tyrosine-specific transport protein